MNILAINFSGRKKGNCAKCIEFCLDELKGIGHDVDNIDILDFNISPCGNCEYACFREKCPKEDDFTRIISKCKNADKIIFAIPSLETIYLLCILLFRKEWKGFICPILI